MSEEIGVCNANPRISEMSPSETAAVYQFANKKETITNPTKRIPIKCTSLMRLYLIPLVCERRTMMTSMSFVKARAMNAKNTASEKRSMMLLQFVGGMKTWYRNKKCTNTEPSAMI